MRILVVEDSEKLRCAIRFALHKAGYVVDTTGDGEEGLWFAESNDYDAIVLDLMLPGLDGLTVLRRMRDSGRDTPALILTVRSEVADRVAGLRAGADDYLSKPFAFDELLARVEALVRRRYGNKRPVLRVGELEVPSMTWGSGMLRCRTGAPVARWGSTSHWTKEPRRHDSP